MTAIYSRCGGLGLYFYSRTFIFIRYARRRCPARRRSRHRLARASCSRCQCDQVKASAAERWEGHTAWASHRCTSGTVTGSTPHPAHGVPLFLTPRRGRGADHHERGMRQECQCDMTIPAGVAAHFAVLQAGFTFRRLDGDVVRPALAGDAHQHPQGGARGRKAHAVREVDGGPRAAPPQQPASPARLVQGPDRPPRPVVQSRPRDAPAGASGAPGSPPPWSERAAPRSRGGPRAHSGSVPSTVSTCGIWCSSSQHRSRRSLP